ncbi:YbaY family lipoprotein [Shewanella sp. Isolate11]|uniref:YbaY family lipoprotein n=1 Tax=Shewanella sp. Isolate11 TaxID=2908530 RepID=UPI001EFC6175|nr:YbaY family lipoprotein [Shewanella sp. Isolate11]MCG9696196.1 YbaY family lipoprotein [Shewanella sp. Isolate11]
MKLWFKLALTSLMALGLFTGCASSNSSVEIVGEVWFKERIALPQDAVLTVQVQDISKMDTAAVILAEIAQTPVVSPAAFKFVIPADQFQKGHTYAIGAKIHHNDKLLFINTQTYQVDVGSPESLSVLVQRVGR